MKKIDSRLVSDSHFKPKQKAGVLLQPFVLSYQTSSIHLLSVRTSHVKYSVNPYLPRMISSQTGKNRAMHSKTRLVAYSQLTMVAGKICKKECIFDYR